MEIGRIHGADSTLLRACRLGAGPDTAIGRTMQPSVAAVASRLVAAPARQAPTVTTRQRQGIPMSEFAQQRAEFSAAIERELATRNLNFPTVLDLSLRIKRAADDPDSTLEDIAKLVRIEPVLSARVIQMANSVIFNRAGNSVTNVSTAVRRIGISNVRVTALIVAMDQLGQEHRSRAMRDLARAVWAHSVDVASWAYALARHLRIGNPDTALFAGLMADIGQFFLIARVGSYPAIAADFRGFSELVGFWNAALRRAILETMALPADILDALEFDNPYGGKWPPRALHEVLFVAGLAAESDNPFDPEKSQTRRRLVDAARLELDAPRFDDLLAAARQERQELLGAVTG